MSCIILELGLRFSKTILNNRMSRVSMSFCQQQNNNVMPGSSKVPHLSPIKHILDKSTETKKTNHSTRLTGGSEQDSTDSNLEHIITSKETTSIT